MSFAQSVFSKDETNSILSNYYTKSQSNARYLTIGYQPPQVDLSPYALKTNLADYLPWQVASDYYAPKDSVYTISQADQTFVSKTFFDEFTTYGIFTRDQADARFAKVNDVFSRSESDARYMSINYTPPAFPDLSLYLLTSTANTLYKPLNWEPNLSAYLTISTANTLYKGIDWFPDLSAYALKSDLNFVAPSALTSYFTKTESDARFVCVGSPIVFPTNVGHDGSDGKRRFYFANNGRSYHYSSDGYEWRNADDSSPLLSLENDGDLLTRNVALQYNTLFLALNQDGNHYISHGMSNTASTNYNIDGVVFHGGVGGGILGQGGTTALKWLSGTISIPWALKVSGATNLNDISVLPRNGNDTNPAFSVQAYSHDNIQLYLDAYYDSVAATVRPSHSSYFRIHKVNSNLFIGAGTSQTNNTTSFNTLLQIAPAGQVTIYSTASDALSIQGSLNTGSAIYIAGNKVATEAAATTIATNIATNIVNANKFTGGTIQYLNITGQVSNYITPTLEGYSALTGNGFKCDSAAAFDREVAFNGQMTLTYNNTQSGCTKSGSGYSSIVSQISRYGVAGQFFVAVSDKRTKKNFRPIQSACDIVNSIMPVVYDRKDGSANDVHGFVAQDLVGILDDAVVPAGKELLGIDLAPMVAILWQVVKDLKQEIPEIKRTIKGA
ncbi:hypothetical protein HK104_010241 [Borealophlyctis nickersoniae]|nr:hypothetical protein HK104_010241 [Borealophlyctis nickersoniae]